MRKTQIVCVSLIDYINKIYMEKIYTIKVKYMSDVRSKKLNKISKDVNIYGFVYRRDCRKYRDMNDTKY